MKLSPGLNTTIGVVLLGSLIALVALVVGFELELVLPRG